MAATPPSAQDPQLDSATARNQELREVQDVTLRAVGKGGAGGLAVGLTANLLANKYSSAYRAFRAPGKAFIISSLACAAAVTFGERALTAYERERHSGYYHRRRDMVTDAFLHLPLAERAGYWLSEHRFAVSASVMVAVLGGSFLYNYNNRLITKTQKAINMRMFTHFATLGTVLLLTGFAASPRKKEKEKFDRDYWMLQLGEDGKSVQSEESVIAKA